MNAARNRITSALTAFLMTLTTAPDIRADDTELFLAEADWQDSDAGYSDDSRALMAAMITSADLIPSTAALMIPPA